MIADEGRACVIVINKWDTVPNKTSNTHVTFKDEVLAQLRGLSWATVLFTSASTGDLLRAPMLQKPWNALGTCASQLTLCQRW